jgi:antitoxin FitA
MASITVDISESQLQQLQDLARQHGIQPEELLRVSLEELLSMEKKDFSDIVDGVLDKNSELYRRLA